MFDLLRASTQDDYDEDGLERAANEPYGPSSEAHYADPGYQEDGKKRYPLDTEDHCRSAWSFINKADNADRYTPDQLKAIKKRIMAAGKEYGVEFADQPMSRSQTDEHTPGHAPCCPDVLDDEAHVFRREFHLDGIDILRGGQGGDGRTVEAYASVFDSPTEIKDQHGHYMETIHRSAFDEVLRGGISRVKVFYNHGMNMNGTPSDRWSVPIGVPLEVRADGKGLRTITRFNQGADADQILEAIRNGAITGYSFRGPIRQSNPPRVARARDGQPLPTVTRTKLGLTEYGPTPAEYYTGAKVLALRSRLSTLDPAEVRDILTDLLRTSTPEDQDALRTIITATPTEGPGAEDQPSEALRSAADIARDIRLGQILRGMQ